MVTCTPIPPPTYESNLGHKITDFIFKSICYFTSLVTACRVLNVLGGNRKSYKDRLENRYTCCQIYPRPSALWVKLLIKSHILYF